MASRKVETKTLRSSVSEVRAKSAVMGTDTDLQVKGASSEPSYEAITQQIAYLMSAVTNQTHLNLTKNDGAHRVKNPMERVSIHSLCSKDPKGIKEYDMLGMWRFRT